MRSLSLPVCAVAALVACAAPALAQTARFVRPTDTIHIFGETLLEAEYTVEAVLYRETGQASDGRIFGEQLNAAEDKGFRATQTAVGGAVWNNQCDVSGAYDEHPLPAESWRHVAFERHAGHYLLYIDGQLTVDRDATCAGNNANGSNMALGAFLYVTQGLVDTSYIGYIDWFRISSVARYTSDFTPPACEPASDADTILLFLLNESPGSPTAFDSGPNHFAAFPGDGLIGATEPVFGPGPFNPNQCCIADFNNSGGTPDDADIAAFFTAWNNGDDSADVNRSGGTPDDADVSYFFFRWNDGC